MISDCLYLSEIPRSPIFQRLPGLLTLLFSPKQQSVLSSCSKFQHMFHHVPQPPLISPLSLSTCPAEIECPSQFGLGVGRWVGSTLSAHSFPPSSSWLRDAGRTQNAKKSLVKLMESWENKQLVSLCFWMVGR